MKTQQLELAHLASPPPSAYYLNPDGAPGCSATDAPGGGFMQQECSTIFEDLYRPYLVLPAAVGTLQEVWRTCTPFGMIYDPPRTLRKLNNEAKHKMTPRGRRQVREAAESREQVPAIKDAETTCTSAAVAASVSPQVLPVVVPDLPLRTL